MTTSQRESSREQLREVERKHGLITLTNGQGVVFQHLNATLKTEW